MKEKEYVRRSYDFDVSAVSNESGTIITGRPIVYGQATDIGGMFREIIDKGALDKTDLRDVRFLVNHNVDMIPLARSRRNNGNSTMQMTPDEFGLRLDKVSLDVENNADARALWSAVDRGDISGMSFMFTVNGDRWENLDSDYPTRYITDIGSVFEVSAVTFPAYEQTEIYARDKAEALENARHALDNARNARSDEIKALENADKTKEQRAAELALAKAKFDFASKF